MRTEPYEKETNMNSPKDEVPVVTGAKYVILGGSGNTGSIIANSLLSKGQRVRVVGRDLGPGSVFADPSFDAEAAQEEALVRLRGLADHFEKGDPGMHKTNTVDYAVVYDGEMWLELDDGETLHLKRGDVVVQNGTRHAWRNKGNKPVTMLFFLNGARARETSQA